MPSTKLFTSFSAEFVLGEKPTLKEIRLVGDWVIWLEKRSNEKGRTTVFAKKWGMPISHKQELTPFPINVSTKVHGYGGGAFSASWHDDQLLITWIDDSNGCLFKQSWTEIKKTLPIHKFILKESYSPLCLSKETNIFLANGLLDISRNRWIGVMEFEGKDFLVQYALDIENQEHVVIYEPKDFIGYIVLSPTNNQLAWVEWQKPFMPWDSSQIWHSQLDFDGQIDKATCIFGCKNNSKLISVFQPIWISDNELLFSEDSTGWWNLTLATFRNKKDESPKFKQITKLDREFGLPQWTFGMSTIASSNEKILALNVKNGIWKINLFYNDFKTKEIELPFTDFCGIDFNCNHGVTVASNQRKEAGLLEFELDKPSFNYLPARYIEIPDESLSIAEPFWFKGFDNQLVHSWYYPPKTNVSKSYPPLLVKVHSGPTSISSSSLNLEIQFWTSRGWAVVDVNYGGSSGFGRLYRERLHKGWGVVDVYDCVKVAESLIESGKADKGCIAIEGSSAGGFTTLACLSFTDIFKVGACRYGVTDLIGMANTTHRFEADYLNYLVGDISNNFDLLYKRSPLNNAIRITSPVIFFQGMKDKVVLPEQARSMVNIMKQNNVPVKLKIFPEEGHGFRDGLVKIDVLNSTYEFFSEHLDY